MLTINCENFIQNRDMVFREIVAHPEGALIEVKGLGKFRVCYQPERKVSGDEREGGREGDSSLPD